MLKMKRSSTVCYCSECRTFVRQRHSSSAASLTMNPTRRSVCKFNERSADFDTIPSDHRNIMLVSR